MNSNRVVVVTGAAGGIGSLIVRRFLSNGDTVIATDTSEAALATLANAGGTAGKLYTAPADISEQASCSKLAEFAAAQAQRVDVLVNCAGFFPRRSSTT